MKKRLAKLLAKIAFIIIALLIPFTIWYILLKGIFWAFGGSICGYQFSYKIVLGAMLMTILIRFAVLSPLTRKNINQEKEEK